MAMDINVRGAASANGAEVAGSAQDQLKVILETNTAGLPQNIGGIRNFSENDPGAATGAPLLFSPETDLDFRQRASVDTLLDEENFQYTAQNTGKHTYLNTTMAATWATGALTTNSAAITTLSTGLTIGSYATFPLTGTNTLSLDIECALSAAMPTNTTIDFGLFLRGAATPYAPTDGAYFRFTANGLQGVVNYNGTELTTSVLSLTSGGAAWVPTPAQRYQFILYVTPRLTQFWLNNSGTVVLLGQLNTPVANGQPFASSSIPFSIRHAISATAASSAVSLLVSRYSVRSGGVGVVSSLGEQGNRVYGSYQGLSGGTMGALASYVNNTTPTAAVPTNTTAALGTGLGGQFYETATLAVATDGIICSYQVPAATAAIRSHRLRINGIHLNSFIQTAITGGPYVNQYTLAFGHTAVSLATAEAASTKKPRYVNLPGLTQVVTSAQAVSTISAQSAPSVQFANPIYVNPGEFVALIVKRTGTVATAGVVGHLVQFDYSWE